MDIPFTKLEKWKQVIDSIDQEMIPIDVVKKVVFKLEDGKQKTINLSTLRKQGLDIEDIEVVVNNEGSPKDASANVKPQVDVNKMVVEIVTRDIRNNGPIRKSLRTGAE